MAYTRHPFKAKINTALKESDYKNGASPTLWSIEDIIEIYGGWPRKINDQSVLRYKINLQAVMDREKQTMMNEFKKNIDREIENRLLKETNRIREDLLEKQVRVPLYRGGQLSGNAAAPALAPAPLAPAPAPLAPAPAPAANKSLRRKTAKSSFKKEESFGLSLINDFLNKIQEIDFNTDMRFFEVDDTEPVRKNKASGGGAKKTRKVQPLKKVEPKYFPKIKKTTFKKTTLDLFHERLFCCTFPKSA